MPKKRKNKSKSPQANTSVAKDLQALSSMLVDRSKLLLGGQQYGGDRDVYQALGYPQNSQLTYRSYWEKYDRQDMAKAVIDRPVKATWRGGVEIIESDDKEDSPLQLAWDELNDKLSLVSVFSRLDRLTGIGRYGTLLLGLDDVKTAADYAKPVEVKLKGKIDLKRLKYVKPLSEDSAKISIFEEHPGNERFGKPVFYAVQLSDAASNASSEIKVHHSRIVHVAEDLLESEVLGTPRLKAVFNRLMDLEKLVGGSGEMFWRGARSGMHMKMEAGYDMKPEEVAKLQDQMDEFDNNLRRIIRGSGFDLKNLAQQIADPKNHVDIQIIMISAVTGIPKRILTGTERGELASSQDDNAWKELTQGRREDFAEPLIVRAFVDRMILYGILPKAEKKYTVKWSDLWVKNAKELAEVGKILADTIAAYSRDALAQTIIPPAMFLQFIIGLNDEQIKMVEEARGSEVNDETNDFSEEGNDANT